MKKFLVYGVVAMAIIATSCEKKSDEETPIDEAGLIKEITAADTVFAGVTAEESKQVIEDEGLKFVDEMQVMEQEMPVELNETFFYFLDAGDPFKHLGSYKSASFTNDGIVGVNKAILNYDRNQRAIVNALTNAISNDEPETLADVYNELVGVYSWSNNDWVYEETGDVIRFEFPSTENGTSNDANFVIDLTLYTGAVPDEMLENNIPASVSAELAVGSSVKMGYYLDAEYDTEGYPTKVESKLAIGNFAMTVIAEGEKESSFEFSYYFTHNSDLLVGMLLGIGGDWSESNIDDNLEYTLYGEYYDPMTGNYYYDEIDPSEIADYESIDIEVDKYDVHKVITNGNTTLQIMNLKLVGNVNFEGLGEALIPIIEDEEYEYDQEGMDEIFDAINENISLALRRADDNAILAMVEAYPVEYTETYYDWYWDETLQEWVEGDLITETYYEPGFRFVFADGSPVDMETYFGEGSGFDDLMNEMEDWMEELEDTYDL